MAETGEDSDQHRPSPWDTLTQVTQHQSNNGWSQSGEWHQPLDNNGWNQPGESHHSLNDDSKWKSDGWDTTSGQKEHDPPAWTRSSRRPPHGGRSRNIQSPRSPRGDLRQLIDRRTNCREGSPSPARCGRNAPREHHCDRRRKSWNNNKKEVSTSPKHLFPSSKREAYQPGWGKRGEAGVWKQRDHPTSADSYLNENNWSQGTRNVFNNIMQVENENQQAPSNKLHELNDEIRCIGEDPHSPSKGLSRSRSSSPFSQAAKEVTKSSIENESDGWGLKSSLVDQSRPRSLSPWSQAAHNIQKNSNSKDTDIWGKALDRLGLDSWNQAKSIDFSHNGGFNRGGHSASQSRDKSIAAQEKWKRSEWDLSQSSEHKWRKTGWLPDRSRCTNRSLSPENRPTTEWCRGRSRGRGRSGSRSLSRFNRREGIVPTDTDQTKDEREKQLGCLSPKRTISNLNYKTGVNGWGPNQKESDGWGQNSSPVKTSKSRSVSPWSQAAIDIGKNYNNKEIDGWGTALDQTASDAWNEPKFSLDRGFKRGECESRGEIRSPASTLGRTGWEHERRRGRYIGYSPNNKQRSGNNQGGSRYRGRGHTSSPYRCQNRRAGRDPSYSPIDRPSRSPNLQTKPSFVLRMDENREKRDVLDVRYDKKTNGEENAARVTSREGVKWQDSPVNAVRSSVNDSNLIFNWSGPTNTGDINDSGANHTTTNRPKMLQSSTECTVPGVAGNVSAIPDIYCEKKQMGLVMEETFSQGLQVASQSHGYANEKVVQNSPGIEHPTNETTHLPLSYDPWAKDACIASSHGTSTLLVNPTTSQSLSQQQNTILASSSGRNLFQSAPWGGSTNMLQKNFSQRLEIASQSCWDVKEHPTNDTSYIPLSYDPWDNDACIASSYGTSAPLVNSTASHSLSNQQNGIVVSNSENNFFQSVPWSGSTNMLQKSYATWSPSTAPFGYPMLEPKTSIGNAFNFSNLLPIGGGPLQMPVLNVPTVSGIDGSTMPPARLPYLPPFTSSNGIISLRSGTVPEAIFPNSDAAMKHMLCADNKVRTSCSGGTVIEAEVSAINLVGHTSADPRGTLPQTDQNDVFAGFSKPNIDTVMQPISCTDMEKTSRVRGSEMMSELSSVNPVDPNPVIPKLALSEPHQKPIIANDNAEREKTNEVDDYCFQWALVHFAKPKLRPFWLKEHLTDVNYRVVLDKFVKNVTNILGDAAPRTHEKSCKYVKEQDASLNNLLKSYLQMYMSKDIIENMRYNRGKSGNHKSLVF